MNAYDRSDRCICLSLESVQDKNPITRCFRFLSFKDYNVWICVSLAPHRDATFEKDISGGLIKGIRSVYIVTLVHNVTSKYNKNVFFIIGIISWNTTLTVTWFKCIYNNQKGRMFKLDGELILKIFMVYCVIRRIITDLWFLPLVHMPNVCK